jgi:hypothetical protein
MMSLLTGGDLRDITGVYEPASPKASRFGRGKSLT